MDNLIEYILIALLVIIIFQLLFGSSKCKSEHMNIVDESENQKAKQNTAEEVKSNTEVPYEAPSELLSLESSFGSASQNSDNSGSTASFDSSEGDEDSDNEVTVISSEPEEVSQDSQDSSVTPMDSDELTQDVTASDIVKTKEGDAKPHFNKGGCMIEQTSVDMDRYVKNMLMRELPHCGSEESDDSSADSEENQMSGPDHEINEKPKASNVDIEGYYADHLNFYDKVNGSSKDEPDMVDKVNEFTMGSGKCGVKIQDVYDKMTTGDTAECVKKSNYDRVNALPLYKTKVANGNMYSDDMWRYENEKVSNGGNFYGSVAPSDNNGSGHMIY